MTAPISRGFEYEVRLAVSIPLAWATLLKEASKHHYDYKCRATGDHGTVNGLFNTACDGEWPSTLAVSWSDLDLTTKVAEQLEYHTPDHELIRAIRAWLRQTMDAIEAQRQLCLKLPGTTVLDNKLQICNRSLRPANSSFPETTYPRCALDVGHVGICRSVPPVKETP